MSKFIIIEHAGLRQRDIETLPCAQSTKLQSIIFYDLVVDSRSTFPNDLRHVTAVGTSVAMVGGVGRSKSTLTVPLMTTISTRFDYLVF
jgi:hypothetical protein